jgi:hypothetical protein
MKNKIFKPLSIALIISISIFIVQSCAMAVPSMPIDQMTFKPKETKNGLIFGSITFPKSKAKFNAYFLGLHFKSNDIKLSEKNSTEIEFVPEQFFRMKHNGELDNGLTYLFAIERPEGDYEFCGIRLFENNGIQILNRDYNLKGFSVPFSVKKGEISYVGNFNFNEYDFENEKAVSYNNNFEKDLAGIKKAQIYVYWNMSNNDTTRNITYIKKDSL